MPRTFHRSQSGWIVAVLTIALCLLALTAAIGPRPTSAATSVFINEIHYDNTGTDAGEAIEVAGPAGTNLTGWSIVLYNGTGGASYDTDALTGVIPNQQNGFGTVSLSYPVNGIQNGSPDGIALVNASNVVVQFLSYEGAFAATNGVANGMMSTDIGVSEAGSEVAGQSLRLSGTGCNYEDFTWNSPATASFGAVNTGQTFSCAGGTTLSINDVSMAEGDSGTTIFTFTVSLSAPAGAGGVTFDIATQDNTAMVSDNDYVMKSLTGQTIASGNSTYMFDVTVNGDMTVEPNETFFVNVTNITGAAAGDVQGIGTINNDDFILTPIHDIQGSGTSSPLSGSVTTTGIVTGVKSNGFFIQEPDAQADANPNTSEGIFVFTSSAPPAAAAVGNSAQVTGTVQEFIRSADPNSPPATQIAGSPTVTSLSTGNPLPASITLTAADTSPSGTIEQLERFEGMRVHVDSLTAIAPTQGNVNEADATSTSNGVFYGVITGVARPFREPGVAVPDPLPAGSPCCVPRFDANPERLRVDSDGLVGATPLEVTSGAIVTNLTGPLDYAFRTYTILPDPGTPPSVSGNISAIPVPVPANSEFTVASFNMERFFDTVNDAGVSDVALTGPAFDNRLKKASLAIRNVMLTPDIIGVEEMENLTTLQAVATKINNDAVAASDPNPNYQAYLVEGNDIGGIDVGFLVKASRVTVIDVTQFGKTTMYTEPGGAMALLNDRPPLVLRATITAPDTSLFPITVIVNHLRSLSGVDDPLDGDRVRTKRRAQAEYLANLIQTRQTADPNEHIISVGDYNAFEFNDGYVDGVGTIKGMPTPATQVVLASSDLVNPDLTDLIDFASADQKYSYSFDGSAQALDHELITANLLALLSHVNYARNGADFPESFRDDRDRPERISDHDMAVAYFTFPHVCSITCPQNQTQSNDPDQCGAFVSYPSPTVSGTCFHIGCSPTSGSFFPIGTTTVTCAESIDGGPSCSFSVTVNDTQPPSITCPANVITSNDPNQCGAVVTYPAPTVSDICPGVGTPLCSPASGSFFPKGTTTVTCTVGDASGNTASCTFTISVNDTQPPSITCPPNQTAVTNQNACPSPACQTVNYPAPVATDHCPGVGVVCNPPSGSCFPAGVTTVTCTATDTSGNTATCSFTVTVFDVALQDDSNPSTILLWNSITGQYRFCCNGTTYTGFGKATRQGCVYTLQTPTATDRRILGRHDKSVHTGSGSLQSPPGAIRCNITDRNTLNDTLLPACQ
jgi:predicted extracellular nuclease